MPTVNHPLLNEGVEARAYQLRSLERALSASTLMVMPTGFGKTAVEWMAMAEYLRTGARKIILIAPTTGLVDQQRRMAQERLALPDEVILAYTGDTPPAKREALWEKGRIIIATPQVIRNDAMKGLLDLSIVDLLIVDEAHHATGNHAYAQVGKLYTQARGEHGRVLAATASPGSNIRHISEVKTNLNAHNLDLTKRSEALVAPYDVDMEVHQHRLELPPALKTLLQPIEQHFEEEVAHLKRLGFLPPKEFIASGDIEKAQLRASRAIAQRDVRGYDAARRVADLRRIHMLTNLLKSQGTEVARSFLQRAEDEGREGRKTNRMLALPVIHALRLSLNDIGELHPKVEVVDRLVQAELTQKPEGKILIFTEYRDTVKQIVANLNALPGVEADAFIGQSSRGNQKGMNQKEQLAQLNRFRSGEINVLVATSVGEEGLDVPSADLVILYEPVPSAIRAIQRRGRTARQRAGSVHVLIAQGSRDVYVQRASEQQESNMHRLMKQMVRQRNFKEYFEIDHEALAHFSIVDSNQRMPAKEFLEREISLNPNSIEQEQAPVNEKRKASNVHRTAAPLTPEQRRPKEQMGLDHFAEKSPSTSVEPPKELATFPPTQIQAVLNAASKEMTDMNTTKGANKTIQIDHREVNSTLPAYLHGLGFNTELTQLPHGDLRLSSRVLIERKTSRDLLASIKNGRLLSQCHALKASAPRPLLLVETGGDEQYALHPNAVLGALAHITLDLGIPVMMTKNAEESAHFVALAAKREHDLLESLHIYLTTQQASQKEWRPALDAISQELEQMETDPEADHPWMDTMIEHLHRCFHHTVRQYTQNSAILDVLQHFSPDLGAILVASKETFAAVSGCDEALAQRVIDTLNQPFKSQ